MISAVGAGTPPHNDVRRFRRAWALSCALLGASFCLFSVGCSGRPEPTLVKKDGGDDEEEAPARNVRANREGRGVNREARAAKPGNREAPPEADAKPVAATPGRAPFDTSLLPSDSEVIIHIDVGEVLRSSLVQNYTGGRFHSLGGLVSGFGVNLATLESVTIGIRNLDDVPLPSPRLLVGGLESLALMDLAAHPDVKSTIVVRSADRIEESALATSGESVPYQTERYYRVDSTQFVSPCAFLAGRRTVVVSDEQTIQSLIVAGRDAPKPTADLSFVRKADFVVAMVPKNRASLHRWLPAAPQTEDEAPATSAEVSSGKAKDGIPDVSTDPGDDSPEAASATVVSALKPVNGAVPSDTSASAPDVADGEQELESPDLLTVLRLHAEGIGIQLNLQDGVAMSLSARCDTPESAESLRAAAQTSVSELRTAYEERRGKLPPGFGGLVEGLRVNAQKGLAFATTAVPKEQQGDVLQLPGFLLGLASGGDPELMAEAAGPASSLSEPPRQLAEQTLVEGIPPVASPDLPEGLEVRALARWKPSQVQGSRSRELQLAVVAFGGPALNAAAVGQLQLVTAEVNRVAPLKWVGTSHLDDSYGLDPLHGFVPVDRDNPTSVHPVNGVIAVFDVVPPTEASSRLRRFAGQFTLRHFNVAEEIVIPNVRQLLADGWEDAALKQAGVEVSFGHEEGRDVVEVFYDESAGIGRVELIHADGSQVSESTSTKTVSRSKTLRTLSVEESTIPADVGLRIVLKSELQHLAVPFEFAGLPIPDVRQLSDFEQSLLVWTPSESPLSLPSEVLIEAQARWDNPAVDSLAPATARSRRTRYDDDDDGPSVRRRPLGSTAGVARRSGRLSQRPLRVVVDLTGPLVETADAVGFVELTSIATDFGRELALEGAYFRQTDASGDYISRAHNIGTANDGPPGGIRVAFHLTPPLEPINALARLNGSLKLRTSRNRTETVINNLMERLDTEIVNRDLTRRGVALAAAVEGDAVFVRVVRGNDDQISAIIPVDVYGDPIPGVTTTREEGKERAEGHLIHRISFSNGVPSGVGLRVFVNSSVNEISVPFRFVNVPVPPMPALAGR